MSPPETLGADTTNTAATVGTLLTRATETLRPSSPSARLDAELLLGHVLGRDRSRLILERDQAVAPAQAAAFAALVARRGAHEPVAYLVGSRGFRWLQVGVDPRVLIPRPETELLVELVLTLPRGASVLDVGTGSGAIALAVKHERPDLSVSAVDVSEPALAVAAANADRLGLEVDFASSDLLEGVGRLPDALLANLPYVVDGAPLPPDVRDHEPPLALFAGADGLSLIRRLTGQLAARDAAQRPRLLALEIGADQGPAVAALLRGLGYPDVEVLPDLAGLDRVVCARLDR